MRAAPNQQVSIEGLPTLTQVFAAIEPSAGVNDTAGMVGDRAHQAWGLAIAAMSNLLKQTTASLDLDRSDRAEICRQQGIVFCGPTPIFNDLAILAHFKTWAFVPKHHTSRTFQLPPALQTGPITPLTSLPIIPVLRADPLIAEQFCLIQTAHFCWVAVLGIDQDDIHQLQFSFEPSTVQQIWLALQLRVEYSLSHEQGQIKQWRQRFPVLAPHYRIPAQFSRELLHQAAQIDPRFSPQGQTSTHSQHLSANRYDTAVPSPPLDHDPTLSAQHQTQSTESDSDTRSQNRDIELLKVLAHEVRTPLTTIQTLTRLLLKRSDLPQEVMKRLDAIQRECKGQIDRFGLIFRAVELTNHECQSLSNRLTPILLQAVLEDNLGRWQAHAARRALTLEMTMPKHMPAIFIRDPDLLDQVLTGLMEYLSYSLPPGSHIHLNVALAGPQLKLQLTTQADETQTNATAESPMLKAVGQLLMFQPETGGVSLSLSATKHLFQALGGKLTVRNHHHSEVLTIFLPLGTESDAY